MSYGRGEGLQPLATLPKSDGAEEVDSKLIDLGAERFPLSWKVHRSCSFSRVVVDHTILRPLRSVIHSDYWEHES